MKRYSVKIIKDGRIRPAQEIVAAENAMEAVKLVQEMSGGEVVELKELRS